MAAIWRFVGEKKNRTILAWLGGGAVIVIGGLYAAYTDPKRPPAAVCAGGGAIAVGGSVSGSKLTTNSTGSASTDCKPATKD